MFAKKRSHPSSKRLNDRYEMLIAYRDAVVSFLNYSSGWPRFYRSTFPSPRCRIRCTYSTIVAYRIVILPHSNVFERFFQKNFSKTSFVSSKLFIVITKMSIDLDDFLKYISSSLNVDSSRKCYLHRRIWVRANLLNEFLFNFDLSC